MKRIAIPIENGLLSLQFGNCQHYVVFDIEKGQIIRKVVREPHVLRTEELPAWVAKQGITDVIAYKVDNSIMKLFAGEKISLFVGIQRRTPADIIQEYMNGSLKSDEKVIKEIINQ